MVGRIYLVVEEENPQLHVPHIIDMTVVLKDVSLEEAVEAIGVEYERLRGQYPVGEYEIQEVMADSFSKFSQEAEYLKAHKPREVWASEVLRRKTEPAQKSEVSG